MYQLNGFDLAIMIPYFPVLVVLAVYGLHRYCLVYTSLKIAKNVPGPPPDMGRLAMVTVQLPIYNERYVIERLVEARGALRLSARTCWKFRCLMIPPTRRRQVARRVRRTHQALGFPIHYMHRTNREGLQGRRPRRRAASCQG